MSHQNNKCPKEEPDLDIFVWKAVIVSGLSGPENFYGMVWARSDSHVQGVAFYGLIIGMRLLIRSGILRRVNQGYLNG
ncbi:predicted protein [Sclerotinia sclerotiorum 1980 UF-70]|uniref:Transmembrane protein n=1 Tax=Sclerotinia sclerotiorum (strain ATCC 18683 / 1980 / Ss-1) TaxID=665079 RepID=A7EGA8_SCLS1|nr:predicted protein [Sclerotinia sclerotiorum 1980 UF-70]EDO01874.1 predicted protein [Sclerotinia sclerotiorum 1980 UF-70]